MLPDPPADPTADPAAPPLTCGCGCGCGFPISPGMYVHWVAGRPHALGCVSAPTRYDPADPTGTHREVLRPPQRSGPNRSTGRPGPPIPQPAPPPTRPEHHRAA